MEAFINDGLAQGLVQHPPACKLGDAEAALRNVGFVQWVEPMDIHFLAMGCLIANDIPKLGEASFHSAVCLAHHKGVHSGG